MLHRLLSYITNCSRNCMHYDWTVQVHIHPIKLEYRIIICTCEFFRIGARWTIKYGPLRYDSYTFVYLKLHWLPFPHNPNSVELFSSTGSILTYLLAINRILGFVCHKVKNNLDHVRCKTTSIILTMKIVQKNVAFIPPWVFEELYLKQTWLNLLNLSM